MSNSTTFQPEFLTEIPDDGQAHVLVPVLYNRTLYYRFDGTNKVIQASKFLPKSEPLTVLKEILDDEDANNDLLDAFGDFILSKEGRNTISDAMDALALDDDTESHGTSTTTHNDSESSAPWTLGTPTDAQSKRQRMHSPLLGEDMQFVNQFGMAPTFGTPPASSPAPAPVAAPAPAQVVAPATQVAMSTTAATVPTAPSTSTDVPHHPKDTIRARLLTFRHKLTLNGKDDVPTIRDTHIIKKAATLPTRAERDALWDRHHEASIAKVYNDRIKKSCDAGLKAAKSHARGPAFNISEVIYVKAVMYEKEYKSRRGKYSKTNCVRLLAGLANECVRHPGLADLAILRVNEAQTNCPPPHSITK